MAHSSAAIMAGCAAKDGNHNLFVVSLPMMAGESERAFTWGLHYDFLLENLGDSMNNKYTTVIMDENASGMRARASALPSVELLRCA